MNNRKKKVNRRNEDENYPLPIYDSSDDIYNRGKELPLEEMDKSGKLNMDNEEENPGSDLDIPGTESDDENEAIGAEDEENNYYSIGGENHDNLEEGNADQ